MEEKIENEQTVDKLTTEQMIANLKSDVRAYTSSLENAIKDKENYVNQLQYTQILWDILSEPNAIRKLNPVFEYENNEKWWEAQHMLQLFKIRQDKAVSEGTLKQLDDQIKSTQSALDSAKEKLDRFGGSYNE